MKWRPLATTRLSAGAFVFHFAELLLKHADRVFERSMTVAIGRAEPLHVAETSAIIADEFDAGDAVGVEQASHFELSIASLFLCSLTQLIVVQDRPIRR